MGAAISVRQTSDGKYVQYPAVEALRHRLTAQRGGRRGGHRGLDPIAQRADDLTCGIDDVDPGLHHRCLVVTLQCSDRSRQVVGGHHVIASHDGERGRLYQVHTSSEVAVDPEILLVAQIVHPGVRQFLQPARGFGVRVLVVDHHQAEVAMGLGQDAAHGGLEEGDVPVERQHDIDQHGGRIRCGEPIDSQAAGLQSRWAWRWNDH